MIHVDIEAAAARMPELLGRVEQGEEVSITRNGKPVADLVRYETRRDYWSFYGAWKGKVDMSRFDEADEEIARAFGMLDEALA
ncbi:MAG TPA: type II toxin-antitoxin system prevent-host-death family antitoxin [Conexibacter sp.]|nr:type II toxin-antitoxin system prevent-host-death family antitoxin [Conexibacter sp.]